MLLVPAAVGICPAPVDDEVRFHAGLLHLAVPHDRAVEVAAADARGDEGGIGDGVRRAVGIGAAGRQHVLELRLCLLPPPARAACADQCAVCDVVCLHVGRVFVKANPSLVTSTSCMR